MTTFTLSLRFAPSDLELIRLAGQRVALRRSLATQDPANVVWLAFSPFAANTVTWTEDYGLYAAQSPIVERRRIEPLVGVAAQPGAMHTLNELGTFDAPRPDPTLGADQFALHNQFASRDHMTLGLRLGAVVNEEPVDPSPINAVIALRSQTAVFTPRDDVTILLAAPIEGAEVLAAVPGAETPATRARRNVFGRPHRLRFSPQDPNLCAEYRDGAFAACS